MTSWTYIDGSWVAGNPSLIGPMSHAMWLGSIIFDGARAFEGCTPDLDRHCARSVQSARTMALEPMLCPGEIEDIAREGVGRFPSGTALYIRPMFWAEDGDISPDPASTRFALAVYEKPMPPSSGVAVTLSRYRSPTPDCALTAAKASCLYPNNARSLAEARQRGFDNAVMLDMLGHVTELATANLFLVKDGIVHTPVPNGCFLNGITRQRVIKLLRKAGVEVIERTIDPADLASADEIFTSGNVAKLRPVARFEERWVEPGPVYRQARTLYWDFAHSG